MNIKEHNDAQFTKQKDEVEAYLMRIIQRYFSVEQEYTKNEIESIVVESLTRLKQDLLNFTDFIFNINNRTGAVTLTITGLGGETAFEKKTAFNKDFGNTADTITEGNDERLSDDREPLRHVHEITDIKTLQKRLDELGIIPSTHVHSNKNVVNMLRYTGSAVQIDLIMLEYLEVSIGRYYDNLEYIQREAKSVHTMALEQIQDVLNKIVNEYVIRAKFVLDNAATFIDEAIRYINTKDAAVKAYYKTIIKDFITKQQLQRLIEGHEKHVRFISDGEFPLPDGEIKLTQKIETDIVAGNGDGDSLKKIYDEGQRMGNDDWIWDNETMSFVYQHNEEGSYPLFLSLGKFNNYTHRVTLASKDGDNDGISVVIAYDAATGNHLSLILHTGGLGVSNPCATVTFNYPGNYNPAPVDASLKHVFSDVAGSGWHTYTKGIPVLIKFKDNNIKIWVKLNEDTWQVQGKEINPTELPLFDFNLADYSNLSCFMDKEVNYGYGCFSQPLATFKDVFFLSSIETEEPYGTTFIDQETEISHQIDQSDVSQLKAGKGNVKTYFRYDKDGKTVDMPIPFMFRTDNNSWGIVQTETEESGQIHARVNILLPVEGLFTEDNFYDDRTIIVPIREKKVSWMIALIEIKNKGGLLCDLSGSKKMFIINLLPEKNDKYWVSYLDKYETFEGSLFPLINKNGNIIDESSINAYHYYIVKYIIKYLSEYFDNPRIYYKLYDTENPAAITKRNVTASPVLPVPSE